MMGLSEVVGMGRFKLTGVSVTSGPVGIMKMAEKINWKIEEIVFLEEGQAIVHAKACPPKSCYGLRKDKGRVFPMHIKAVNARARALCKESKVEEVRMIRHTGAEGEEGDEMQVDSDSRPGDPLSHIFRGSSLGRRAAQQRLALAASGAAAASPPSGMRRGRQASNLGTTPPGLAQKNQRTAGGDGK